VLRARCLCMQTLIALTPGSSPPERSGLDKFTSQSWSESKCPCNTAFSTLSCLFQQKERDKAELSTSRGGTRARCLRPWLTRDIVQTRLFRRGCARCHGEAIGGCDINGAPLTPDHLLALLRELSHVPQDLPEIAKANQVRKTNKTGNLYQFKTRHVD